MRVAVVYFQSGYNEVKKTAESLARGISAENHMVDLFNGETDTDKMLTSYEYIVIGTSPISFFTGKISDKITNYLNNAGMLSGKRSYAFIRKKGLSSSKALRKLMQNMEKEGMMFFILLLRLKQPGKSFILKNNRINVKNSVTYLAYSGFIKRDGWPIATEVYK